MQVRRKGEELGPDSGMTVCWHLAGMKATWPVGSVCSHQGLRLHDLTCKMVQYKAGWEGLCHFPAFSILVALGSPLRAHAHALLIHFACSTAPFSESHGGCFRNRVVVAFSVRMLLPLNRGRCKESSEDTVLRGGGLRAETPPAGVRNGFYCH